MTRSTGLSREILRLAIPSILANITIPLVSIVDVIIVGHISSAAAIGGIAVGTMLFDLLYWNFGFLRVGTSGLTAQAYGRSDRSEQQAILHRALRIAVLSAVGIWLIQWLFVEAALYLTPCSSEVASFARRYFFVRIWAAPATLSLMAFKGWFIGMQNTVAPMTVDVVVNAVNMLASYVLAVYTPLEAIGVAWGTLLAQYTGLIVALCIAWVKYPEHLRLRSKSADSQRKTEGPSLLHLNLQLIARSLCFMVIYVGYTALFSSYGDTELAVATIMMKLFMLISFLVDGFAYAAEAMVGSAGADASGWQNTARVGTIVRTLSLWMVGIGLVLSLLYGLLGEPLFRLFTSDTSVQAAALRYLPYLWAMPTVSAFAFLFDGVFIGAALGKPVRNCMIYAAIAFVGCYLALKGILGVQAIYVGYLMHLVVRSAYLFGCWKRLPRVA